MPAELDRSKDGNKDMICSLLVLWKSGEYRKRVVKFEEYSAKQLANGERLKNR